MSTDEFMDTLRVRPMDRKQLLDNMDHAANAHAGKSRRGNQRLEYRADKIQLTVTHPGGTPGRFYVKARNLSSGGLSFIHGGFLHLGTECRIVLVAVDGQEMTILGKVRSCRYISANVHEVGVEFYEKIDVIRFVAPSSKVTSAEGAPALGTNCPTPRPQAISADVLVVSTDVAELKALGEGVQSSGMHVVPADCMGAALDQLKRLPIDVVLWADGADVTGVTASIAAVRGAGYKGAIVAIVSADVLPPASVLDPGGVCAVMARPIDMRDLTQSINDLTINAGAASIFSELNPNTNSSELISFFVDQTRTAARELSEALAADDLEAIRRTCRNLKGTAGGYGFSGVAEAARHADTALATATKLEDAAKQVQYLMSLLKRVKGGYAPPKAA